MTATALDEALAAADRLLSPRAEGAPPVYDCMPRPPKVLPPRWVPEDQRQCIGVHRVGLDDGTTTWPSHPSALRTWYEGLGMRGVYYGLLVRWGAVWQLARLTDVTLHAGIWNEPAIGIAYLGHSDVGISEEDLYALTWASAWMCQRWGWRPWARVTHRGRRGYRVSGHVPELEGGTSEPGKRCPALDMADFRRRTIRILDAPGGVPGKLAV